MATIIVVDDNPNRLNWLQGILPTSVHLVKLKNIQDITYSNAITLIIVGQGKQVEVGHLKSLPDFAPVLVWNADPDEADEAGRLLLANSIPCVLTPYCPYNLAAIKQFILSSIY